jgi:hypothetical protein
MTGIPCDNQIRAMLDPVEPAHFFPVFDAAFGVMEKCGGLGVQCENLYEGFTLALSMVFGRGRHPEP